MVQTNSIDRRIKRWSVQDSYDRSRLIKLKALHDKVDWRIKEQRREFLRQLYPLIDDWQGQFPNLRDIFRPEQIDRLLAESVDYEIEPTPLYDFVLRCGYEDEAPRVGEELYNVNERLLRRATALHRAVRCWCPHQRKEPVRKLFKIYNRFEVHHCDDESGLTHFHVALWFGLYDLVAIFRVLHRLDPSLNGDPPLHWALREDNPRLAEWLLRRGADPDSANARGETPLHLACSGGYDGQCWSGSVLLTKGADPNASNARGSTPLHRICERDRPDDDDGLAGLFFALCDLKNRPVRVDAKDNQGRTPLQSAVAGLGPNNVDLLLARGADLSKFRFPTEDYFAERLTRLQNEDDVVEKLRVATGILACVERLEYREYELDLNEAMTVMKIYDRYGLFDRSGDNERCRYDDEVFVEVAKRAIIGGSLTLRDLTQLTPEDATRLLTFTEHYALRGSIYRRYEQASRSSIESCLAHFFEKLSRSFFCRWALYPFQELMNYRLPIKVCQTIVKYLKNEDLYQICLLTARA